MDEEKKEAISALITLLKAEMQKENLIFSMMIDKKDVDNSKLAFIDKEIYLKTGLAEGMAISISDSNKGLL